MAMRALGQDVLELSSENLALLGEITLGAADGETLLRKSRIPQRLDSLSSEADHCRLI